MIELLNQDHCDYMGTAESLTTVYSQKVVVSGPEITVGHRTISDQITVCLTKMFKWSENLSGQNSSEALLKIIRSTFMLNIQQLILRCASAGVVLRK